MTEAIVSVRQLNHKGYHTGYTAMRKQTVLAELTQKPTYRGPYYRKPSETERDRLIERIVQLRDELRAYEHSLLLKYGEEVEI